MTIKDSKVLSNGDWVNLNGNDLYVCMLKNKVKVVPNDKQESQELIDDIREYLELSISDLVYYQIESVYGYQTMEIYFESGLDKENFIAFYNTSAGIKRIQK